MNSLFERTQLTRFAGARYFTAITPPGTLSLFMRVHNEALRGMLVRAVSLGPHVIETLINERGSQEYVS